MAKKENEIIETENFTEDDFDNFLDYLEEIEELNDDDDDLGNDVYDDDEDDEDETENMKGEIVPMSDNRMMPANRGGIFGVMANSGVNFGVSDRNGSCFTIGGNGIGININPNTISDAATNIDRAVTDMKYRRMKKKIARHKKNKAR